MPILKDWNLIKLKGFSRLLSEVSFKTEEYIYNIGDLGDNLYIIKSGSVRLEAIFEIERTNIIPTG